MAKYGRHVFYNYSKDILVKDKETIISYIPNYNEYINDKDLHYLLSNDWCLAYINQNSIRIEGYNPNLTKFNIQSVAQKILFNLKPPKNVNIEKIKFCYVEELNKPEKYSIDSFKEYNIKYKPPFLKVHGYYNTKTNEYFYSRLSTEKQEIDKLYENLFFNIRENVDKHKLFRQGYIEFNLCNSLDEVYSIFLEGYNNYINEKKYLEVYENIIKHLEVFNFSLTPLSKSINYINLYYSNNGYSEELTNNIHIRKIEVNEKTEENKQMKF